MQTSFVKLIRNEFNKGKELSLDQLYSILSKNPDMKLTPSILKHRIRSSIYSLQQNNEITRVGEARYKKN